MAWLWQEVLPRVMLQGVHECADMCVCEVQLGGAAPELTGGGRLLCDGQGPHGCCTHTRVCAGLAEQPVPRAGAGCRDNEEVPVTHSHK